MHWLRHGPTCMHYSVVYCNMNLWLVNAQLELEQWSLFPFSSSFNQPSMSVVWVDFGTLHSWSVPPISLSRSPPHLSLSTTVTAYWCLARNQGIDVIVIDNFNKMTQTRRSLTEPCRMSFFQSDPSIFSFCYCYSSLVTVTFGSPNLLERTQPLEKPQKHRKRPISQTLLLESLEGWSISSVVQQVIQS